MKSITTSQFWKGYEALPIEIQRRAADAGAKPRTAGYLVIGKDFGTAVPAHLNVVLGASNRPRIGLRFFLFFKLTEVYGQKVGRDGNN
ncbi:MAG: hypothetical protein IAE79_13915 [Anaerolinea sp.]|nr:hypothetical protein [Anaerolinea sp.]